MFKYPDSVIITIDDDAIYPNTFIEDCINAYKEFPTVVNAGRIHKVKYENNRLLPYKQWEWESQELEPSYDLFFTGVGGVVYPPNAFNGDLNLDIINEYLRVDDIVLNVLCRKHNIKVRRIPMRNNYKDINILPAKYNLCTYNTMYNNDIQLKKINFEKYLVPASKVFTNPIITMAGV